VQEENRQRILVVEDEQIVALDLKGRLERLGYQVPATAATGAEAIAAAAEHRPDLVLMDVKLMGTMDGIEVAAKIQETADTPIVYLTAFGDEATLERAKAAGCYGYLLKPFEERELAITIDVALFRRRMSRQLEESEAWFSATVDAVAEGIVASLPDGRVRLMNAAAEALTGWRAEAARGRDVAEVLRLAPSDETPAPAWAAAPQQVLTGRDGVARAVEARAATIRDAKGKSIGGVWVIRDVSERRRILAGQHLMMAASAELSASFDDPGALDRAARLVLPALADLCVLHLGDGPGSLRVEAVACAAREDEAAVRAALSPPAAGGAAEAARVGAPVVHELPGPDALGDALGVGARPALTAIGARWILSVPLPARGRVLGALTLVAARPGRRFDDLDVALATDLGRRVAMAVDNARLYRDAQRAIRARENALAIVSHDLQTPLGVVSMAADMLLRGDDPDRVRVQAPRIQRSVERMRRLIRDLLDAARLDDGRLALTVAPCAPRDLTAGVLEECELLASEKAITLAARVAVDAAVLCDRERVHQVLANIVGNAMKFTPRGGTITVSAELDGAHVRFAVADSGPGVPADELPHLFDRYWQGQVASRQGTGLGLHIARGFVELHGGCIWAESRPGGGSTFFFTLPCAAPAEAQRRPAA
jgi:PAS domain S-box-containing protein